MVLQPRYCLNNTGLGSSAFARHYLRNHYYFLLLWVLRCFSSPRSPPLQDDRPSTCRVAPFGNPGIKDYLHLPPAYRSLSRPSSPPRAKASTVCPCLLSFVRSQLNVNRIDISSACSLFVTLFYVVHHVKDLFQLTVDKPQLTVYQLFCLRLPMCGE